MHVLIAPLFFYEFSLVLEAAQLYMGESRNCLTGQGLSGNKPGKVTDL